MVDFLPGGRQTALRLESVMEGFRPLVVAVDADPTEYIGKLLWLVPTDPEGKPVLERPVAFDLKTARPKDFYTFFAERRALGERFHVILYWRVSSPEQAKSVSLSAQLRWMLKKCADAGVTVAGIGMDQASGSRPEREALDAVNDAILAGHVQAVIVPTLSRLERNLKNFTDRLFGWTERDSVVYYGATYSDAGFEWVHWNDGRQRIGAVQAAHKAEMDLSELKGAISSAAEALMEEGFLNPPIRRPLMFHRIVEEDPDRPFARRRLVPCVDEAEIRLVAERLRVGAEARDADALTALAKQYAERLSFALTPDHVLWELRMGFFVGLNRRGPDNAVVVEAPSIAILTDRDLQREMVANATTILELDGRKRNHTVETAGFGDDDMLKLAELETESGRHIRARVTCDNDHPLVECKVLEVVGDAPADLTQVSIFCPRCGGGRNNRKVRWPKVLDLRSLQQLPEENCWRCGRWATLQEECVITFAGLTRRLMACTRCVHARFWTGTAGTPQTDRAQVAKTTPPAASNAPKPPEIHPARFSRAPRPLWTGQLPVPAASDVETPFTAAKWVADFIRPRGLEFAFSRAQFNAMIAALQQAGPGGGQVTSPRLLRAVRWLLEFDHLELCISYANNNRFGGYVWLEPAALLHDNARPVAGGAARSGKKSGPFAKGLPPGVPKPLLPPLPERSTFYPDCGEARLRERLIAFLRATTSHAFLMQHLRVVALGRDVPRSSHRFQASVANALADLQPRLADLGVRLTVASFVGYSGRVYWCDPINPGSRSMDRLEKQDRRTTPGPAPPPSRARNDASPDAAGHHAAAP